MPCCDILHSLAAPTAASLSSAVCCAVSCFVIFNMPCHIRRRSRFIHTRPHLPDDAMLYIKDLPQVSKCIYIYICIMYCYIIRTLGPKENKQDLLWAIWSPRDCGRRTPQPQSRRPTKRHESTGNVWLVLGGSGLSIRGVIGILTLGLQIVITRCFSKPKVGIMHKLGALG